MKRVAKTGEEYTHWFLAWTVVYFLNTLLPAALANIVADVNWYGIVLACILWWMPTYFLFNKFAYIGHVMMIGGMVLLLCSVVPFLQAGCGYVAINQIVSKEADNRSFDFWVSLQVGLLTGLFLALIAMSVGTLLSTFAWAIRFVFESE